MTAPSSTKFAIIGAGIHGLSTALHLAEMLKASGKGSGEDILVVDKGTVGS
jgi:glycine/D-amino acid oxidase-like deaminating enzyme